MLKVADFGIGAIVAGLAVAGTRKCTAQSALLTTSLRGAYTPLYASPEQMLGKPPDKRDDVYALGVIWLQLLTGDLGMVLVPSDWRDEVTARGLPASQVDLLSRALAGKAERRPADAGAFAEALAASLRAGPAALTNSIGMRLVPIPAGTFLMGSPDTEEGRSEDEGPQHEVEITRAFYLGAYPVTQAEYQAVLGTNPAHFSATGGGKDKVRGTDTGRLPVECVSWDEAMEFCRKLNALDTKKPAGHEYRLPTEAEWEYACQGPAPSYQTFHFGSSLSSTQANFDGNFPYGVAAEGPYLERSSPVGSCSPNAFGVFDMHGNVWEWCADWYAADYYKHSPRRDPPGPSEGSSRVFRGGGWCSDGLDCRSACRGRREPTLRSDSLGFRVALVPSNLERLKESGRLDAWVEARLKGWDDAAWKGLLRDLQREGFFPLDQDRLGLHLEKLRKSQTEAPQKENLQRLKDSGWLTRWVEARLKGWNHAAWEGLLRELKSEGYHFLNHEDLGKELERIRAEKLLVDDLDEDPEEDDEEEPDETEDEEDDFDEEDLDEVEEEDEVEEDEEGSDEEELEDAADEDLDDDDEEE